MMRRKIKLLLYTAVLTCVLTAGCGDKAQRTESAAEGSSYTQKETDTSQKEENASEIENDTEKSSLEDGTYLADFNTDSGMFHVSEACDGKGTLTVKDGKMTIHISLASKNIVNLYPGLAEDAQKDGAELLEPTVDTITYSDGISEEVYGFDVPVPTLNEEFDLALVGTKGTWYDHKVSISNPEKAE